ncbi:SDR family NAD(P)-dependent oxidoreductase [Pseudomonas sp. 25 R 14]|uniref:SDR family NAD(P)-dependent oxidoreductase n=1 Tax=Pseudomonas sp. 25 R 14 TaxID=1844109 RepID=UPI0008128B68|nr:SDR family NAD(P)-dependent oxidoreductase [Pseudomonas sp. 25 R 14]CRM33351.1 Cyclopentanol dehydrogenase [Pseudomonas sp. 25 R 14]
MNPLQNFNAKVVLVTGAASGIGLAATLEFARRGAHVVAVDMNETLGIHAVKEVQREGGQASFYQVDITDENAVKELIDTIHSKHQRLDAAFNNAGIFGQAHTLATYPKADWDRVIEVNLTGPFLCLRYELAYMQRQGHGAIVNTSSVGGMTGPSTMGAYAAAKWGLIGLSKVAAMEHARFGIRVNAIAPGLTDTPMNQKDAAIQVPGFEHAGIEATPMHRAADPIEIARAAVWLCSDEASFITGQVLPVDGGYTTGGAALQRNPLQG